MRGEGPARTSGKGRADIHYRLEIEIPKDLSDEQKRALEGLAEALNDHDPRERLMRGARRGGADRSAESEKVESS